MSISRTKMNIRKEIAIEAIEETLKFYLESYNPRQNKLSINLPVQS